MGNGKMPEQDRYIQRDDFDDAAYQRRREERMKKLKKRKRDVLMMRLAVLAVSIIIIAAAGFIIHAAISGKGPHPEKLLQHFTKNDKSSGEDTATPGADNAEADKSGQDASSADQAQQSQPEVKETAAAQEENASSDASSGSMEDVIAKAQLLADGYDYDAAIEAVTSLPDYESSEQAAQAVASWQQQKASCVAVDVYSVPHIFYHSLLNDTDRAFNTSVLGQFAVDGMNAWMTTIEEFDKITQQLYDNGYVYVRLRDLVKETQNADGSVSFEANTQLMLPPGKKAIVLSIDDLSYYHSYKAAGFPDKLVIDDNGLVKCQYTDASGQTTIGDYDVIPRLNTFLREHPDGSYHGARGLVAMTGYNGVFGYRTDQDYELRENLMEDQARWLEENPDFNRQEEIEKATVIADAIKAEGWEFASHTWGHLSVTGASVDKLRIDNERWVSNVQNIVGPVDTIIFAHGNDIGNWEGYSSDNEKYAYYHGAGYNFFCNVDGSVPYWVQITSDYVRQGRIDLDGYMLYRASTGQTTVVDSLFTASEVFDQRRPTPVVANGQG